MWARADLNCQPFVYQTNTLPLSYAPIKVIGVEGFEPSMAVPKTAALPLGYTPVIFKIFRGSSSMARILGFKLRDAGSIPPSPAEINN